MRVLDFVLDTVVDGPGLRASVYLAGCKHCCPGCHNPQSWDMNGGTEMSVSEVADKLIESGHTKFTISGGDPFYQPEELYRLVKELKTRVPNANIWCYTGFKYEDLRYNTNGFVDLALYFIDVLVDGPFVKELTEGEHEYRGSSNQHIIYLHQDR